MASGREPLRWFGRVALMVAAIISGGLAAVGYWLGDTYIPRLSDHAGYYLVQAGQGQPQAQPANKPRRTVVVVVDGLRADYARSMTSAKRLERAGTCLQMPVGELTVSRPVYAVLSTGLEADRTGARNNDETSPLVAESVWENARKAGLTVHGASDVPYWQQLFPVGFDRYVIEETRDEVVFEQVELADITLIHASYPDAAGHDHGASSDQYRDAVARTDRELMGLLERLDLSEDMVVLTADHGHVDRGGHGGPARSISVVWTCFAGPTISSRDPPSRMDARSFAPALSVLWGVAFPANMRAGDDDLDTIFELVDSSALGQGYVEARKQQIEKMRAANALAVADWSDSDSSSWSELYRRERNRQLVRMGLTVAILLLLLLLLLVVGYREPLAIVLHLVWMAGLLAASASVYVLLRGSFDFTSINLRAVFVSSSTIAIMITLLVASCVHLFIGRSGKQLAFDLLVLTAVVVAAGLGHRIVYGVPLGFPLPGRYELFFPFMGAAWAISLGFSATVISLVAAIRTR
ncbi:MAG: alkaline phosphatase family protein [Deltaproteobacteria bacterium]|nr:alkaline phosphatase family protein [Deltaproteobacteria bacterium]